jgi:site-specific DNA-methyltransferase (adenine-specific)
MHEFRNHIICGDCIELLSKVEEPFADLAFADPPFNIGYQYDHYKDTLKKDRYLHWTRDWMAACVNVLKPTGSFYIAIGAEYAAHIRIIGEELGLICRNWIIWHYTFGQHGKTKFSRAHAHIFYFAKDEKDVWNTYSRVCGTFKERQSWHPCQMPELLLARIIAASSNPGDLVLDPFNGSGTTAAAAMQLGRNYCGLDISENYVENTKIRLEELKGKQRQTLFGTLDSNEYLELKRLFVEMGFDAAKIIDDDKLLRIFTRQFEIRMNNPKTYDTELIQEVLKDFLVWNKKRQISG